MDEEHKFEEQLLALKKKVISLQYLLKDAERKGAFFEMLIRGLPGVFYLVDDTLTFHRWNENLERVTGYSPEELSGKYSLELFFGEDATKIEESLRTAFEEGEAVNEAALVAKDGTKTPYLWTGVSASIEGTSYLVGMAVDLSERKRAESALRESEAMYRTLTERMTIGVMLCQQFRIVTVNKALASMFGYGDSNELVGKEVTELAASGYRGPLREMVEGIEEGSSEESSFQVCGMTKAGGEVWVDGWGKRIEWKGAPTVLLTGRDITEAKEREISMREETEQLRRENVNLRSSIKDRYRLGKILGKSSLMQEVYELIVNAASADANVVIYGESGTGKELVAGAIHEMSRRSGKPFVPVNSAAIPENLLESEFFGHKKGAFTGAYVEKQGYLDMADGGTLFLDEIAELTPSLQAKLLRALEGGGYSPVGGAGPKHSDFRIIGATNEQNLMGRSRKGLMRKDFFYRVHVLPIRLPPLRERRGDIPLLLDHFFRIYREDEDIQTLPGHLIEACLRHDWPGNVRELQNVIQRYLATGLFDLRNSAAPGPESFGEDSRPRADKTQGDSYLEKSVEDTEKAAIRRALDRHGGRRDKAAAALGISRMTLYRKMRRFELT